MNRAPPPVPSPSPALAPELSEEDPTPTGITGEWPIQAEAIRAAEQRSSRKLEGVVSRVERRTKRASTLGYGAMVSAVGVCFAAFFAVEARSQHIVDKGLEVQAQKHEALKERVDNQAAQSERTELKVDRLEQKVDLMLDKMRVPVPPELRTPKADGGPL